MSVAEEDRENPRLVREGVKCGKPSCRCAGDAKHRHGPYIYLRYEEFDRRTQQVRYRREYVPESEVGAGEAVDQAGPGRQPPVGARS
jgi:hypothetical protein